ncbi:hypothetical protein [Yeosuana sp. AK3]
MKRFLRNSIVILVGIIMVLFLLDNLYTYVYNNTFPRNKTQYILNLKEGEKLDYVFIGSSRVENTIITSQIEKITHRRSLNLGSGGAKLDDMNIFLRLLIDKNIKIDRLFVQVDYLFNDESNSDIVRAQILPYLKDNKVINDYLKKVDTNYNKNYYIPFYRYATNDYRLGFREFVSSSMGKKPKIDLKDGYVALFGNIKKRDTENYELPNFILKSNKSIIEIDSICKVNKIEVTYFCAPFCSKVIDNGYVNKLGKKISGFKNYSRVIKTDSSFINCSHLNNQGAQEFTKLLIEDLNL